jgi:formate dehydrogenase major subunit
LGGAASVAAASGGALSASEATVPSGEARWDEETASICPYCAVGCGMIVKTSGGKVVDVEGDPSHPINRGTLCSKGASLAQLVNSDRRITHPMYRSAGSGEWKTVEWDWALDRIAARIKKTRDEAWIEKDSDGRVVRRTETIASVGSAALDNEECSLLVKALRSMGLVYIEHQARI